ncbi:hypothetical protein ABPG72_013605 [Tetrahymena utriculariae]
MEEIKRAKYKLINFIKLIDIKSEQMKNINEQIIIKNEQNIQEKRCKYKIRSYHNNSGSLVSYKEYIKNFRAQLQRSQQEENSDSNNILEQNKEVVNFLQQNKRNIFKNILKSFKRHIKNCLDLELQRIYENLTEGKWNFQNIKKRICQNLKIDSRCNLKMKNILKSEKKSKIFIYYLTYSDKLWLQNSRLLNKEEYKKYISLILKANQQNLLVAKTQHYHKKKKSNIK